MHVSKSILLLISVLVIMLTGCEKSKEEREVAVVRQDAINSVTVEKLAGESVDPLQLQGELSDTFRAFSNYTDLQREKLLPKVIGRVIQWTLPVYEISLSRGIYTVTTNTDSNTLSVHIYIKARTTEDDSLLEKLKTGDFITFKGRISDIFLRSIVVINPAILIRNKVDVRSSPEAKNEKPESEKADSLNSGRVYIKKDPELAEVDVPAKLENESAKIDSEKALKESPETTTSGVVN